LPAPYLAPRHPGLHTDHERTRSMMSQRSAAGWETISTQICQVSRAMTCCKCSQSRTYSPSACMDNDHVMLPIHWLPSMASLTSLVLLHLSTAESKVGARSATEAPSSHLLTQNRACAPLPILTVVAKVNVANYAHSDEGIQEHALKHPHIAIT
jgi:hypothetical protein